LFNETEIIKAISPQIESLLSPLRIVKIKQKPKLKNGTSPDLVVITRYKNKEKLLIVKIKSVGEPRYIEQAISQLKLYTGGIADSYPIVASSYLSEKSREICRKLNVGYIDLTGNIFIDLPYIHIEKESEKAKIAEKKRQKNLFSPISTRIIRTLLVYPSSDWSIKSLSNKTGASLGYTHRVVERLLDEKILYRDNNFRLKLKDPKQLLEEWSGNYFYKQNTIYPLYTFEKNKDSFFKKLSHISRSNNLKYALTLHSGAHLIAPYVRFTEIHFYIDSSLETWKEKLDLRPVESGANIYLLKPYDMGIFQDIQTINGLKVVSNIQLYLDLYNYPKRGREQAEFLREKKLKF